MSDGALGPMEETKFHLQVLGDARRTIICSPELESRVKCHLTALGVGGLVEVVVSTMCPDTELYVIATPELQASTNQALQRLTREWRI